MINDSIQEYLFIRFWITFLHHIAPVSIVYWTVILLWKPDAYRLPWFVEYWCLAESLFYLCVYTPRWYLLQQPAIHPTTLSRDERQKLFQLSLEFVSDAEQYLSKWFKHAPMAQIKRENVKDFFCWAFLNKSCYDADEEEELDEYVDQLDKRFDRRIEPGRGSATCLRLTLDTVDMLHRSLTWYVCVFVVDSLTSFRLRYYSFHFHCLQYSRLLTLFPPRLLAICSPYVSPAKTLSYWYRPHTSRSRLPVLFIHGIGIGLYPYVNFLKELKQDLDGPDGEVGIIAIEIMPISFRMTHEALGKAAMCSEVLAILKKHGWEKVVLVSHSYGSIISTHLLRTPETASRIGPLVLIDPVSFLLYVPDVAYNFTSRQPERASEWQLWYFASKDPGVAHTLARKFFWAENILWKHDLEGRLVTVVLCGRDIITDTKAVARYLTGESEIGIRDWKTKDWKGVDLDILWFQGLNHAQVFDRKEDRDHLTKAVRTYCGS